MFIGGNGGVVVYLVREGGVLVAPGRREYG
jgi:hypothetical protein